jgi:hypothetical protein
MVDNDLKPPHNSLLEDIQAKFIFTPKTPAILVFRNLHCDPS